jgi:gamma-glutamyltranspeptidase/glutathione hydrolase
MRRAFADRGALLGDTDFVKVPLRGLASKEYAKARAATIDPQRATPSRTLKAGDPAPFDRPETTHFVVVDAAGEVVTSTYTLNGSFGSGVVAAGTGVLLNNEMDDFSVVPGQPNMFGLVQGEANAIAPRKRPLSSMTPTIVLKDGKVLFAVGSPGGPTIINTVLQIIVNVVDFGMNLREAIDAPRVHHQFLPDFIMTEPYWLAAETRAALEARGHVFAPKTLPLPRYIGDAQGVAIDPKSGVRQGASDPRLGGAPAGY